MTGKYIFRVKILKWVTCECKVVEDCTEPTLIDYGRAYSFKTKTGNRTVTKVIPLSAFEELSWEYQ